MGWVVGGALSRPRLAPQIFSSVFNGLDDRNAALPIVRDDLKHANKRILRLFRHGSPPLDVDLRLRFAHLADDPRLMSREMPLTAFAHAVVKPATRTILGPIALRMLWNRSVHG